MNTENDTCACEFAEHISDSLRLALYAAGLDEKESTSHIALRVVTSALNLIEATKEHGRVEYEVDGRSAIMFVLGVLDSIAKSNKVSGCEMLQAGIDEYVNDVELVVGDSTK